MPEITIQIGGRNFEVACQDGEEHFLQAAAAIANLILPAELSPTNIVPSVFDPRVATTVAAAVQQAARDAGIARV